MANAIRTLVREFGWIHALGVFGSFGLFVGSVRFVPAYSEWTATGAEPFVIGSFLAREGN